MKKSIWAILPLLLFSLTAFGQLEKGSVLLGGRLGFGSSFSESKSGSAYHESKATNFNFSPDAGYFFGDNWVVGLSIPLAWNNNTSSSVSFDGAEGPTREYKSSSYGVAPFVRRYFPFGDKMAAYGQIRLGYSHQFTEDIPNIDEDSSTTRDLDSFQAAATLGLSYFPKSWMGINLSISPLSYSTSSLQEDRNQEYLDGKSSGFGFGLDTSAITLGIDFFLSKK